MTQHGFTEKIKLEDQLEQLHTFYYNGFNQQRVTPGYCIESDHNDEHPNGATWNSHEEHMKASQNDTIQCNQRNIEAINDPRLEEARQE
ncbi:hypothetical protein L3Y34_018194 [Caenorhabditis briggsae]|uniref:Uncharacterized protein n=1 Tax=Caenorhabditis briggsae TaxID=6238 RepID=A0AAE9IUV8_CAEBR|nr:hypothetical protein L3Y34_018194 [Caenorhabditis briggsae]